MLACTPPLKKAITTMKKDTVYTFLDKKEQEARRKKNERLRNALLAAIKECRTWVALPWAEMDQPLVKKVEAMEKEAEPLIEKQKHEPLSEAEAMRLDELIVLYQDVYYPFKQKIAPSVQRARFARKRN
jgi:hypothetical protein